MPLWCPKCDGRNYTRPPGGKVGFSAMEVVCDDCGHRYWFAINIDAHLARHETELREQQGSRTPEGEGEQPGEFANPP
jgi:hypothetical protein